MCTQVIKYQSEDGRLFDTEQECKYYQSGNYLANLLERNVYAIGKDDLGYEVLELMKQHKTCF